MTFINNSEKLQNFKIINRFRNYLKYLISYQQKFHPNIAAVGQNADNLNLLRLNDIKFTYRFGILYVLFQ